MKNIAPFFDGVNITSFLDFDRVKTQLNLGFVRFGVVGFVTFVIRRRAAHHGRGGCILALQRFVARQFHLDAKRAAATIVGVERLAPVRRRDGIRDVCAAEGLHDAVESVSEGAVGSEDIL